MSASKKIIGLFAALTFVAVAQVQAEETTTEQSTETSIKAKDVTPKDKQVKGKDIDEEITNKKLRAELGSKSKFSVSASLGYSGGNFEKPFGKDRPNITGAPVAPPVSLGGSVGVRYRLNARSSLKFGTGISVIQPFHEAQENVGHDSYSDKVDVNNPSLSYSYAHKVGGVQMIHGAGVAVFTADRYTDEAVQKTFNLSYDNTILGAVGSSKKFQVGLVSVVWADGHSSDTGTIEGQEVSIRGNQDDWGISFYPFAEYVLSDTFNLRTVFRQTSFWHMRDQKQSALDRGPGSQSFGLGISVSRDIFLYPNFQFSTENLSLDYFGKRFAKESTVGISATLSVF